MFSNWKMSFLRREPGHDVAADFARVESELAQAAIRIAELEFSLSVEEERANRTAGRLKEARNDAAEVPHLRAENHRLSAEIEALKPKAAAYDRSRAGLIPGGPYRGKGSRRTSAAPATH